MAGWSIWWRIEPCGRIGAYRTTICWWTIVGDQAGNARHGGSSQAIVTFLRDVPPCRQISSFLKVSYIGHCCYSLIDRASNGCNVKYLLSPSLGKTKPKRGCGKIQVARHGLDWLTLVHGPKARLSSTSKRYFGRSGLSQLYL